VVNLQIPPKISHRKSENLLVNHMMDIVPTLKKAPLITTSMNWLQRQALSKESSINEVLQAGDTIRRLQVPRGEAMFVDFEFFLFLALDLMLDIFRYC